MGGSGCSDDMEVTSPPDGGDLPDAGEGGGPSGPVITVTTLAPASTTAPPPKASATWAAYRLDEGAWLPLAAASTGTYTFPVAAARWAVALVCASEDNTLTTVHVHRRTSATTSFEVALDAQCTTPTPPDEFALMGKLTGVPATTQWLDFGYARDSRGVTLPVNAGVAAYEEVGIESGTWDLAFGLRDDPGQALTRVVIRRGEAVAADRTIDVDVAGPLSFVPSSRALLLRGVLAGDNVSPKIYYAAGGPFGIDVGPQDVPQAPPDPALRYSTIPEASQVAGDRYRGVLVAEKDRRTDGRTIMFDLHSALDLDLTFLPDAPPPAVTVVAMAPQLRFETKFPVLANAVRHEVLAETSTNRRTVHAWHATYDAASLAGATEVVDTMPELASLPGWNTAWNLVPGVTATVRATGYETPGPLSDGTMQRSVAKGVFVAP